MRIIFVKHNVPFNIDVRAEDTVGFLKEQLARVSGVPPSEQLLLFNEKELDAAKPLQAYGLPAIGGDVYLYDRRSIAPAAVQPEALRGIPTPSSFTTTSQTSTVSSVASLASKNASPLIVKLLSIRAELAEDAKVAENRRRELGERIQFCREQIGQLQPQAKDLQSLLDALKSQHKTLREGYDDFKKHFSAQRESHKKIFDSTESTIEKLRSVSLHKALVPPKQLQRSGSFGSPAAQPHNAPSSVASSSSSPSTGLVFSGGSVSSPLTSAVTSPGRQQETGAQLTLLDMVGENKLRKWTNNCLAETDRLNNVVADLERQLLQLESEIASEFAKEGSSSSAANNNLLVSAATPRSPVAVRLSEVSRHSEELSQIARDVDKRCSQVTADLAMADQLIVSAASAGGSWDSVSQLESLKKQHPQMIDDLRSFEEGLKNIQLAFSNSDPARRKSILENLLLRVNTLAKDVVRFQDVSMKKLKADMELLASLPSVPAGYQAALEEVGRRRKFARQIVNIVAKMNEALARIRADEKQKRQQFLTQWGAYILRDLVPGLNDPIPRFELSLPPFDKNLPQLGTETETDKQDGTDDVVAIVWPGAAAGADNSRVHELQRENEDLLREVRALRTSAFTMIGGTGSPSSSTSPASTSTSVGTMNASLQHLTMALEAAQKDLEKSQGAAKAYKDRIDQLEDQIHQTHKRSDLAESVAKQWKDKYEKLNQSTIASSLNEDRARALDFKLSDLSRQLEQTKQELQETKKEKEDLLLIRASLESDLKAQLEQVRETLAKREQFLSELQSTIQQKEEKLATALTDLAKAESALSKQAELVRECKTQMNAVDEARNAQRVMCDELRLQLEEVRKAADSRAAEKEAALAKQRHSLDLLQAEQQALQAAFERKSSDLADATAKLTAATSRAEGAESQLREVKEQLSRADAELVKARSLAQEAWDAAGVSEAELKHMRTSQEKTSQALKSTEERVTQLERDLALARSSSSEQSTQKEAELRRLQQERSQLQSQLAQAQAQCQDMAVALDVAEKEHASSRESLSTAYKKQQEELKEARDTAQKRGLELQSVAEQRDKFLAEREQMREQLENLQLQCKKLQDDSRNQALQLSVLLDNAQKSLDQEKKNREKEAAEREAAAQKLRETVESISQKLKEAEKSAQLTANKLAEEKKTSQQLDAQVIAAHEKLAQAEKRLRETEDTIQQMTISLSKAQTSTVASERLTSAEKQLRSLEEQLAHEKKNLEFSKEQEEKMKDRAQAAEDVQRSLRVQLEETQHRIRILTEDKDRAVADVERMKQQLEKMEQEKAKAEKDATRGQSERNEALRLLGVLHNRQKATTLSLGSVELVARLLSSAVQQWEEVGAVSVKALRAVEEVFPPAQRTVAQEKYANVPERLPITQSVSTISPAPSASSSVLPSSTSVKPASSAPSGILGSFSALFGRAGTSSAPAPSNVAQSPTSPRSTSATSSSSSSSSSSFSPSSSALSSSSLSSSTITPASPASSTLSFSSLSAELVPSVDQGAAHLGLSLPADTLSSQYLEARLQGIRSAVEDLRRQLSETQEDASRLALSSLQEGGPKPSIAVKNFKHNDIMLFLPNRGNNYEAYNDGSSPAYFLAPETLAMVPEQQRRRPLLVTAVQIDPYTVSPQMNPYSLPNGSVFYEVIAQLLGDNA